MIDRCARSARSVNQNLGRMPTGVMARFIGGADVLRVSEKSPVRKQEASLHWIDQVTPKKRNVNCVDSRPRTKHNLISCLWTVT